MADTRKYTTSKERTSTSESRGYDSRYAGNPDGEGSGSGQGVYRPMMTSRNLIIQRSSFGGSGGGARTHAADRSMAYGGGMGMMLPPGAYSNMTSTGVNSVKVSREKEKRDMQDLNERFASYIEKVRFLEAQNRKLADELEKLKANWGKETTAIKAMYQTELDEARKLLDDSEKEKARLEISNSSLEEHMEETRLRAEDAMRTAQEERDKVERQNQQLSDYEAEINLLRRRLEGLENDRDKDKKQVTQLSESLTRARMDLDNETLLHVDAENRRQTLEEEMEFMKSIHDQEMKELAALVYRDTTSENREYWKNEMGQALREIQQVYDDKLDNMRAEIESFYNMKLQEFRTGATRQHMDTTHSKEESKRLKNQMSDLYERISTLEGKSSQLTRENEGLRREKEERERELEAENEDLKSEVIKLRAELESILKELQNIMDTKLGLELEIAAYRKLLESEENRFIYRDDEYIGGDRRNVAGGRGTDKKGLDGTGKDVGIDKDGGRLSGRDTMGRDGVRDGGKEAPKDAERDTGRYGRDDRRDVVKDDRDFGRDSGRDSTRDSDRDRDVGRDSGRDSGRDVGRDSGRDVGRDVGRDSGRDSGRDVGRDVGRDSGRDSGRDVGRDVGRDSGRDVGRDSGRDSGRDVGRDSGRDVGRDNSRDSPRDDGRNDRRDDLDKTSGRGGATTGRGGRGAPASSARPASGRSTSMTEPRIQQKTERRSYAMPGEQADEQDEELDEENQPEEGDHPDGGDVKAEVEPEEKPADDFGFLLKGAGTAKTSLQRSAKGPVSISDCDADATYIALENTGRKDEHLGGWILKRTIDDLDMPVFVLPDDLVLQVGSKCKIWANHCKPNDADDNDIEAGDVNSWGQGVEVITKLMNPAGEDRASHTQKISYM